MSDAPDALPASLSTHDGLALHLHHWPVARPKGVVQLMHGLCEHLGRYEGLARAINEAGWAVAGIDHRGHGRSEGPRGTVMDGDNLLRDQALVFDALSRHYRRLPHVMAGSSMGGVVAARFAAALARPVHNEAWARPLDGAVLIAPAIEPTLTAPQRASLSVLARMVPDLALPVAHRLDWVSTSPEVIAAIERDPLMHFRITPRVAQFMISSARTVCERAPGWTVPTLLLYSEIDRLVSPAACQRFKTLVPAPLMQAHAYADMAHDLANEPGRERMFAHLHAWLHSLPEA